MFLDHGVSSAWIRNEVLGKDEKSIGGSKSSSTKVVGTCVTYAQPPPTSIGNAC